MTTPTPLNGWLATSSTVPLASTHGNKPTCADADRVADEQIDGLVADLNAALAALRYIARPTMGLPSGVDPAAFARDGATESNVRIALSTCVGMARVTLDKIEGDLS